MSWVHHCHMAEGTAAAAAIIAPFTILRRRWQNDQNDHILSHYADRDNRNAAKTMKRGVKLVINVYEEVQRRLSSLHRHGSGGGGVGAGWVVIVKTNLPLFFSNLPLFSRG